MKKLEICKNFACRLNDDDLEYLFDRLTHRIGGDVSESILLIQKNQEMDKWLSSAKSANDFFDMIDEVYFFIKEETEKRNNEQEKQAAQQQSRKSNKTFISSTTA